MASGRASLLAGFRIADALVTCTVNDQDSTSCEEMHVDSTVVEHSQNRRGLSVLSCLHATSLTALVAAQVSLTCGLLQEIGIHEMPTAMYKAWRFAHTLVAS